MDDDVTINEEKTVHIFRYKDGHFPLGASENRETLQGLWNESNHLGQDKYGYFGYSEIRSDGTQVWAQVRNGKIINDGVNKVSKIFNDQTGLSSSTRGWYKEVNNVKRKRCV